eukprot:10180097-Lingulodinium_polyedra.AAC.1
MSGGSFPPRLRSTPPYMCFVFWQVVLKAKRSTDQGASDRRSTLSPSATPSAALPFGTPPTPRAAALPGAGTAG